MSVEPSNTEREAARRYPDNPHLDYVPLYAQLKREGFAAGAEWQRAADAEEIARLTQTIRRAHEIAQMSQAYEVLGFLHARLRKADGSPVTPESETNR